eukprot:CAMPEP_0194075122 /NCGR_PEP_ID=MMETSP0149-20130528/2137_1 /TAXON_ID=122233 /ORGANISM="Chaetoceros debilis, Strain MM31A-1" /LENGTH=445 /DNA_ID=CAMNT_0038755481 /DNA_START=379 /DNA_END=1713 /DNA_ORIENTATION=+
MSSSITKSISRISSRARVSETSLSLIRHKELRWMSSSSKSSSTTYMQVASDYLSSMKLKVAASLTSSLSTKERDDMLDSLGIQISTQETQTLDDDQSKNDAQDNIDMTVGEAVASAVAKEAARSHKIMEKQKEDVWKRAEAATMGRINHDIMMQERRVKLAKWEKELEADKKLDKEGSSDKLKSAEKHHHAILGPTLIDLGYKRIHIVSAKTLAAIPIWEKQRVYRHDRAKIMANDKLKSLELGLPGVIALHEGTDGSLAILDGQHRVGMMAILHEKFTGNNNHDDNHEDSDKYKLDLEQVMVEVFPQLPSSSENHANHIFTEINKAESVKLMDMPGIAKTSDRRIINEAAQHFQESYPDMFKPSQRCRSPHLNVDNFRDAIFAAGILQRHGATIKSHKGLVKWIEEKNREMGKRFEKDPPPNVTANALMKARKFDFYLGLDLAW